MEKCDNCHTAQRIPVLQLIVVYKTVFLQLGQYLKAILYFLTYRHQHHSCTAKCGSCFLGKSNLANDQHRS